MTAQDLVDAGAARERAAQDLDRTVVRAPFPGRVVARLAQAGEFGFALLSFTVANAVIPGELADRLLLIVALSMLLTPALFIFFDRVIVPRVAARPRRAVQHAPDRRRVPGGQRAARRCGRLR